MLNFVKRGDMIFVTFEVSHSLLRQQLEPKIEAPNEAYQNP